MRQHNPHFRIIGSATFVGVIALWICGGCWEEIEYTGPEPSAATPRESAAIEKPTKRDSIDSTQTTLSTARNDSTSSRFGDELAELAVREAPSATESSAATTSAEKQDGTPSDDRYDQPDLGARTVSATVDSPPVSTPASMRRAAWLLGSKLSLAALAHDRGIAAEDIPTWFQEASSAAESLQTSLAELPERPATSDGAAASREVLGYLLDQGKKVSHDLAAHHGPDHAALFEVAMKSNLLLALYKPGSSAAEHIAAAIANAAPRAGLPPDLWRPLLDTLTNGAPPADVRAAVRRLHADVDGYLATAVEP